jgi:hypothetical protein
VCPVAPLQGNSALPANCLPPTINHATMAMSETKPDRIEPHAPSHIENVCSIGCEQPSVTQPRSKTVTTLNMSRCGTIQVFVFFFSICFDVILLAVCLSIFRSRSFFKIVLCTFHIKQEERVHHCKTGPNTTDYSLNNSDLATSLAAHHCSHCSKLRCSKTPPENPIISIQPNRPCNQGY